MPKLPTTTTRVSGFESGNTLRVRDDGRYSVWVYRNRPATDGTRPALQRQPDPWGWTVVGWAGGLAWACITGHASTQQEALAMGCAELSFRFAYEPDEEETWTT